jgi:hypothetical protein
VGSEWAEPARRSILYVMQIQLRKHRIRHGQMDAWISGWRSHIEEAGQSMVDAVA